MGGVELFIMSLHVTVCQMELNNVLLSKFQAYNFKMSYSANLLFAYYRISFTFLKFM